MARLNTEIEPSPTPGRESSLYRDPTPLSQLRASTRASTYSVLSPGPSSNSDKENEPDPRNETPRPVSKGKQPMAPPRLPTPSSGSSNNSNKRRRLGEYNIPDSSRNHVQGSEEPEMAQYYDPNQDVDERREVRAKIRNNHRDMEDHRDDLIKPDNHGLLNYVQLGDQYMKGVRQTADAVLDSRFLVSAGELALKKTNNSVRGDAAVSIDLDEFVSKCITFMRQGGVTAVDDDNAPRQTQTRGNNRRRQTGADEEDEEEDSGDGLDWAALGSRACFPTNKRPPVPSFLLGPLSVQRRARQSQARRARSQRQPAGPTTRPQELEHADIKQSESSNLTHIVKGIKTTMETHIEKNMKVVQAELEELDDDPSEEFIYAACKRKRISLTPDSEPCVSLFDFTINPKSFGQTVENLFYVSFLIREGRVKVLKDVHGLPILLPSTPRTIQEQREENVSKHQAVFSLDWPTWKTLIRAFDIKAPLIPHRIREESAVSATGWYS